MEWIYSPEAWIAFLSLTALEIVLGIDNIIFLSILVGRLPKEQRQSGRIFGLALAMGTRILLLLSISWVMKLTTPLFSVMQFTFSGRDLILVIGGLFLIFKSTQEIHHSLEGVEENVDNVIKKPSYFGILLQIAILDIVFSLDSVITAVGLADHLSVMVLAIIISVIIMMISSKSIGEFVDQHPTVKMLALSFLILVGVTLFAEGFAFHIPKPYIYFAMAFSMSVEFLNLKLRKRSKKIQLKKTYKDKTL